MKVISTNIGERKLVDYKGKKIATGIFKHPINSGIYLDTEDVRTDAVVDRKYHGGTNQAVYGYSLNHYGYWKSMYPKLDWQYGMFGENLTIDDLCEETIRVGDTFQVGETILEATLQRSPCFKLGIRFENMKIVKQFWNSTKCGVYFKVLNTGWICAGDPLKEIKNCPENPTIAELLLKRKIEKGIL